MMAELPCGQSLLDELAGGIRRLQPEVCTSHDELPHGGGKSQGDMTYSKAATMRVPSWAG
jgi:hypothetical protein